MHVFLAFLVSSRRHRKTPPAPAAPVRAVCPTCGQAEGFLLDLDGVSHRVLEDLFDTELLVEAAATELPTPVTCLACKRIYTAEQALAFAKVQAQKADPAEAELYAELIIARHPEGQEGIGHRHRPKHPAKSPYHGHAPRMHKAGKAKTRQTADGRTLPQCPECGATNRFFADIGGAAYRVLEDDADTDLLAEASNLLCSACNAVFEFDP